LDKKEFSYIRRKLKKTQNQMAELIGASIYSIHGYEQGWRSIPVHVERQLLYLNSRIKRNAAKNKPCWKIRQCPTYRRSKCPAWEFKTGDLCWLINGTICEGNVQKNWQEKMKICRSCEVFGSLR
jgi:DNA-binding XRE family transcriptional regulator